MKKFLSLLLALTFVFGTMPFSAVASTPEYTEKVTITPSDYDKNGENENTEKYSVYGIYSEALFESDRLSELTKYLEATPSEKTVFVITNGALANGYENVRILMYILGLHGNCVLVSYGNGAHNSVVYSGESIGYIDGEYTIDFAYVTLEDADCGADVIFDDHGIEILLPECEHSLTVKGHVHMNEEGEESDPPCEHIWGDWQVITDSTCADEGTKQRACSACGETEDGIIEKKEHSYQSTVFAPTCISDGYTSHKCSKCGDEYKDSYVASTSTEHKYNSSVTPPTCTEEGYTTYVCEYCSDTYTDEKTPAAGHSWGALQSDANGHWSVCSECEEASDKKPHNYENSVCTECSYECMHSWGDWDVIQENTCDESGLQERTCFSCDKKETEEIAPKGHSYTDTVVPPTCTEDGYTRHECACGHYFDDTFVTTEGHKWGALQGDANGHWSVCSECEEVSDKKPHNYENGKCTECSYECTHENAYLINKEEPTCTKDGYTGDTYCPDCESTVSYGTTVATEGHKWGALQSDANGHWSVCSECEEASDKKPHNYENGKCTECNYECTHTWCDWEIINDSTCTQTGTKKHVCNVCGYEVSETIPEKGHTWSQWEYDSEGHNKKCGVCGTAGEKTVHDTSSGSCECGYDPVAECTHANAYLVNKKEPTCTQDGYTGDTYCPDCESTVYYGTVDPKKDHDYTEDIVPPTCEKDGYTRHECACGHYYDDTFVTTEGHKWGDLQSDTNGHWSVCSECEEASDKEDHKYENGKCTECNYECTHTWCDWEIINDSTCTQTGTKKHVCNVCGYEVSETIPEKDHTWSQWEYDSEGHSKKCGVCGTAGEKTAHDTSSGSCVCGYDPVEECTHENAYLINKEEPTCTKDGYTGDTYCPDCESTLAYGTTEPKKDHNYVGTVTNPTCDEGGYTTYVCDMCGDDYKADETPATGHSWSDWQTVTDSTCTAEGTKQRTCSACSETEEEAIGKKDHNYVGAVTDPTCNEGGYTTYVCDVCGDDYTADETPALGHNWSQWEYDSEGHSKKCGVCGTAGEKTAHDTSSGSCVCGYDPVEECTHENAYLINKEEPTCTEDGYTGDTYCPDCESTLAYGTTEPKKDHSYKATVTDPTCTTDGYTTYACDVCGDTYTDDTILATGHSWGAMQSDANGHWKVCTECEETFEKKPHNYEDGICTECNYECTHVWDEWKTVVDNTCEEKGLQERTCFSCDKKETEEIAPKGHSYKDTVVPPTCTEDGYTRHECDCGHYHDDTFVETTGHDWGDWVTTTEPTCDEKGSQKRICEKCAEYETEEIAAKGHSYVDTVTDPTCEEKGYTTHVCSECDHTYKDSYTDALGHKWDLWVTDDFTHAKKCSVCNKVDESAQHTYTDSVCSECSHTCGHSETEIKDAFDATCTAQGYTGNTYCKSCGKLISAGTQISEKGHDWSDWQQTADTHHKYCTVCSTKDSEGEHDYNESGICTVCGYGCAHPNKKTENARLATCTSEGYTGDEYCLDCGVMVHGGETIPMIDHAWGSYVYTDARGHFKKCANCTATTDVEAHQYESGRCTVCRYRCTHEWGAWQIVTDSTCTQTGTQKHICNICTHEVSETIPAKGHDYKHTVTPPTCTEKGYTTHDCSRCDEADSVDTYVDAKGHSWGNWITVKDSTCTEKGTKKQVCSVCFVEQTAEIEAKGHNYKPVVTEPTCTEKGFTTYTCERCNKSYVDDYVEANGHSFGEWVITVSPTFSKNGEMKRTCHCGEVETQVIPKNEDNTPPVATIIADNGKTWDSFDTSIEFDTFYNKFIAVNITAKDVGTSSKDTSGVLSIEYYTSGNIYTVDQLKNINGWKSIQNVNAGGSFVLSAEGTYVIYVRVTDKVGNAAYFSSSGIVIDRTAPKITADGIDDSTTNFTSCGSVSITATDNYLSKVYINGIEQQFTGKSFTIPLEPNETKYEILVVDAAGNTRELTVFVNGEHAAGSAATCTEDQKCTVCGAVMTKALGHRWGSWTVTKSATAKENGEEMRQCKRCSATETRQTPKLNFPTEFTSKTYTYSAAEGIIDGVKGNTTIEQFLSNMDNAEYIKVFGRDTKEVTDKNALITTGMKIRLVENETSYSAEATIIIRGDTNCDGMSDIVDVVRTNFHCLGNITLVTAEHEAADFNNDGIVDIVDVVRMNFTILGMI